MTGIGVKRPLLLLLRFLPVRWIPSDAVLVFLCTVVVLAGVAHLVWLLAPRGSAVPHDIARQIVVEQYITNLLPQPEKRYIYFALAAAAPPIIAVFIALRRRYSGSFEQEADAIPLLLVVVAVACGIPHDEFRPQLFSGPAAAPAWFTILLCLAAAYWASTNQNPATAIRFNRVIKLLLYGAAMLVIGSWRIFGTSTYAEEESAVHLDAVLYSIAQIYLGATCLHDVLPQYGCYGEFLAFPLRVTGLSVTSVLTLFALLQAIAAVAIIRFAHSLIKDALVFAACGLWLVIITNQVLWNSPPNVQDVYLQYWPLRILFPALSLAIEQSWPTRRSGASAFAVGLFSAAAVCWNLDSGIVVFAALIAFLLFSGGTSTSYIFGKIASNFLYVLIYFAGFIVFACAFWISLSLKAGAWLDLSGYVLFPELFYRIGFYMLPMPSLPDMWLVAACLPLGPMILAGLRFGRGPGDPRLERAAYLAVLSIGVFSYFTGRSHPLVFLVVSWPFIVLAFFLVDWQISYCGTSTNDVRHSPMRLVPALGLVTAATLIYARFDGLAKLSAERWVDICLHQPSAIDVDVDFVRNSVKREETLAILADHQAALIAGIGQRSALPGTGLTETIRKRDADSAISYLVNRGPEHLFIGSRLVSPGSSVFVPWIAEHLETLTARYELTGNGPDGRLMHFERRRPAF